MAIAPEDIEALRAGIAFERERRAPPDGFPGLPPLPAGRYVDRDFLELEERALWNATWRYVAHCDELPEAGSFVVRRPGQSALLILRGEGGAIRAFYNTCQHRGAPLLREGAGSAPPRMVCGYHGWTYDWEGRLVGVLDQRDFGNLDRSCRGLIPVRCERLGNWIFTCEDPDEVPLAEFLGHLDPYFRGLPIDDVRLVHRREILVRCNVKVLLENFLEAYHFQFLHRNTTHHFLDNRGTHVLLWDRGHSMMLTPNRRDDWVDPGTVGMPEWPGATEVERHHNPSILIYPNLVVPVAPTGIPMVAFAPRGPRETLLEVLWMAPSWSDGERDPLWETRIRNFDRIIDEDIQFAEGIQDSLESKGFRSVPLNYQERRIYHWHEELDRRIGAERVPAPLRVEPVLEKWCARGWRAPSG